MNFLSNENYKILYEIVTENITNDVDIFNKVFQDFGNINQNNTESYDLMTYNKQFLTLLQSVIHNKPEVAAQKRKVTFDNKLEEHKQHFLSYIPKQPPTPDFSDKPDNTDLGNIDALVQQTISKRNYVPLIQINKKLNNPNHQPLPQQQPQHTPRKIQIQTQPIEQDTLTKDAIVLDNIGVQDPIANLFSKLQHKINDNPIPPSHTQPIEMIQDDIYTYMNTIQTNINNIVETFEKIKLLYKNTTPSTQPNISANTSNPQLTESIINT